jgi:hypothetical protein
MDEFEDPNSDFNRGLDEYLADQQVQYMGSICTVCGQPGDYNDAPGGGWWSHRMHPADNHDFKDRGPLVEGPVCVGCGKTPDQLAEYVEMVAPDYGGFKSADEAVRKNEGTFNRQNQHFWCTSCYIKVGMPLGVAP